MTAVQGSSSVPLGTAPQAGNADGSAASLPTSLASQMGAPASTGPVTGGGEVAAGPVADPNAGPVTGGAGAEAAAAPGAPSAGMVTKYGTWLGPLLAAGGGFAAYKGISSSAAIQGAALLGSHTARLESATPELLAGMQSAVHSMPKGSSLLKFGGIAAILGGVALTAFAMKAKGHDSGVKATTEEFVPAFQAYQTQAEQNQQAIIDEATTRINALQAQIDAAPPAGGGQTPITPTPGTPTPVAPTDGTGVVTPAPTDGTGTPAPTPTGQTPAPGDAQPTVPTPGVDGAIDPLAVKTPYMELPAATVVDTPVAGAAWTVGQLVNKNVALPGGATSTGTQIAAPGGFTISQIMGEAAGYATVDEANAAARSTMNTDRPGSANMRWMVIEHAGRFYAAMATPVATGSTATTLDPTAHGNVVAWNAMNVADGKFVAYAWSQQAGVSALEVPIGQGDIYPGGASPAATPSTGSAIGGGAVPPATTAVVDPTSPTGTVQPAPGAQPATPATPVAPATPARVAFDPRSAVGTSFPINASSTAEGVTARGGSLQVQRFADISTGGFGTAEEAASAARQARKEAGGGDTWKRWMSLQGSDGRFYVYEGSIVNAPTRELATAAPMHIFGAGFAEYYDGTSTSWKAVTDA